MKRKQQNRFYNKGQWQIEKERCRIADYMKPAPYKEASSINQVIHSVMKKLGLQDQHWLTILENEWADIAGKAVAKHTRPGRFERENLIIFVDSSIWLNELVRYSKKELLLNLQKRFGENKITSLNFYIDPDG